MSVYQKYNKGEKMINKRQILDQVKDAINNRDQIRTQVAENFQATKKIVETQAKNLLKQTKDSKFLHEKVIPLVESEKADRAIDVLANRFKLKDTIVLKQIEKIRQDLIDLKIQNAKVAEAVSETVESEEHKQV